MKGLVLALACEPSRRDRANQAFLLERLPLGIGHGQTGRCGGGGHRAAEPLERELAVEQLGGGCGAFEMGACADRVARLGGGASGPVPALGCDLQRAAAACIFVEQDDRVARRPMRQAASRRSIQVYNRPRTACLSAIRRPRIAVVDLAAMS